ncbi:unnamed protein product [Notodromas monacha]|uniref:2-hydroxyacyl-CoA lyase 2 n=1 Tax=Notodromas monacha TaxID=399045 RepID=A0A7R9BFX9_9CRUS|nr:unnamed protein product [Notodromas monacha]CAG0913425.1 unnamed protein product [Notodromas monacha]
MSFIPESVIPSCSHDWVMLVVGLLTGAFGIAIGVFFNRFNLFYLWTHKTTNRWISSSCENHLKFLHQANPDDKRHGGLLVGEVLKAHGVENIFTLCGGHISPMLVGCEKQKIRVIDVRNEATAVFAADSIARLSGNIGVAAVTAGPGVTNAVTALKNAQMAESSVLLLGGAASTLLKGRGALQDVDQLSMLKPVCKMTFSIQTVRDIVPVLKRAIHTARSGSPGPVFVEFPIDVLYPFKLVQKEILQSGGKSKSFQQTIVNWFLDNYLNNIFAGAFDCTDFSPLPVDVPCASLDEIHKCVKIVTQSKKPVFVIGSQAMSGVSAGKRAENLRNLVQDMGIPCYLGGMARGLLGRKNPLLLRHARRDALKEADCIILAGAVCDFRLSYGRVLNKKAKIISVNRDAKTAAKNSDMFWKPTVAIASDVATFLQELAAPLVGHRVDPEWVNALRTRDDAKDKSNAEMAVKPADAYLNPMKILTELENVLPEDAVLVADGGDFVGTAAYILRARGPLRWLDPGAFGTLGVGAGFAIGAKLTYPDSQVWIIYGDGSCGYSVMEYDTYVRHKLPVASIVGNDAGWTQIAREQVPMLGSDVATCLVHNDYHLIAEALGAVGVKISEETEVKSRLTSAFEAVEAGKSLLINALIGKSNFREGSISV